MVSKRFLSLSLIKCLFFIFIFKPTNLFPDTKKENFYAAPKKQEKQPKKLKENIANELADIMQIAHKNIELYSQISQEIFKNIQELVDQNQNSKIYSANRNELQECIKELENINSKWQTELEDLNKLKNFFKSGCIN